MPEFKDNFSRQSDAYARYKPSYPGELFECLQTPTAEYRLAWDCGTGNGQATLSLTKYYDEVYATDPSEQQPAALNKSGEIERPPIFTLKIECINK